MGRPPPCRWRGATTGNTSPRACAFEDWVSDPCTGPLRPIRHLQSRADDHRPREAADKPDSSQIGIVESPRAMQHNPASMAEDPQWDCDCEVWAGCELDVHLCRHDGGHGRVDGGCRGEDGPAARQA